MSDGTENRNIEPGLSHGIGNTGGIGMPGSWFPRCREASQPQALVGWDARQFWATLQLSIALTDTIQYVELLFFQGYTKLHRWNHLSMLPMENASPTIMTICSSVEFLLKNYLALKICLWVLLDLSEPLFHVLEWFLIIIIKDVVQPDITQRFRQPTAAAPPKVGESDGVATSLAASTRNPETSAAQAVDIFDNGVFEENYLATLDVVPNQKPAMEGRTTGTIPASTVPRSITPSHPGELRTPKARKSCNRSQTVAGTAGIDVPPTLPRSLDTAPFSGARLNRPSFPIFGAWHDNALGKKKKKGANHRNRRNYQRKDEKHRVRGQLELKQSLLTDMNACDRSAEVSFANLPQLAYQEDIQAISIEPIPRPMLISDEFDLENISGFSFELPRSVSSSTAGSLECETTLNLPDNRSLSAAFPPLLEETFLADWKGPLTSTISIYSDWPGRNFGFETSSPVYHRPPASDGAGKFRPQSLVGSLSDISGFSDRYSLPSLLSMKEQLLETSPTTAGITKSGFDPICFSHPVYRNPSTHEDDSPASVRTLDNAKVQAGLNDCSDVFMAESPVLSETGSILRRPAITVEISAR